MDKYEGKIEKVKGKYKAEIVCLKTENQELRVKMESILMQEKRAIEESGCQTETQIKVKQEGCIETPRLDY